jgi:hypothetical protein
MSWSERRPLLYRSGFALLMVDLLIYAAALRRTQDIDPTSLEFFIYLFGGILMNIVAFIFVCFGTGRKRITTMLVGFVVAYLWISYIGIEVMKH